MSASRDPTPPAISQGPDPPERSVEKRWAIVRIALGFLQVFGATFSAVLLFESGVSPVSLAAVTLTCLCTTVSVLLFGSWSSKGRR